LIVNKLGGLVQVFTSEKLTRNTINSIWDDRVLKHACQVFGCAPHVLLGAVNAALPEDLKKQLNAMTTLLANLPPSPQSHRDRDYL